MNSKYNYNTWLQLSPLFKALIVSSTKNGKYALRKTDLKEGFYFIYGELNLKIKVPLGAILETNNKIAGILGIKFISSTDCPSEKLGLCQLPDGRICYGKQGEHQSTPKNNGNGLKGMGGDLNGQLCAYFWDKFARSVCIKMRFLHYCEYYSINELRFNLKGDFRGVEDVESIKYLAESGQFKVLGGYTARDDLYLHIRALIEECLDVRVNGSNIMYNNRFFVTPYIADAVRARYLCCGKCGNCRNCYTLDAQVITCLQHGPQSDSDLNNIINQEYLERWSRTALPWDLLRGIDWKAGKGLLTCLNKHLQKVGVLLRFGSHRELVNYIKKTEKDSFLKEVEGDI